jgi:hypothetical protein
MLSVSEVMHTIYSINNTESITDDRDICQRLTYLPAVPCTPYSMMQDALWRADSHSACQTVTCFLYGTGRFITVLTKPATEHYPEPAE